MSDNNEESFRPQTGPFDDVHVESAGEKVIDKWREFGEISAVKPDLFLFVLEAHGAIEQYSSKVICECVIRDEYSDDAFEYVYGSMSQHHRQRLLSKCGILKQLWNELDNFRRLRNEIAHNRGQNIDWCDDNVEEAIRIAITAVKSLKTYPVAEVDIIERNDH